MTPATKSDVNCERLYDLRVVMDFGTNKRGNLARKPVVAAESYCPLIGLSWEPVRNHLRGRRGPN
jgi:hypothetical protein